MLRSRPLLWAGMVVATVFVLAAPDRAAAQPDAGVQAGISLDPDQFYFGGHVETEPLVDRLRFRPGLDVGIGDDVTLFAINLDFTYTFPSNQAWSIYVGAGPALNVIDFDNRDAETEGGFNILVGAKKRDGLFFEMRVGAMDSPDLKFGVGYTFR